MKSPGFLVPMIQYFWCASSGRSTEAMRVSVQHKGWRRTANPSRIESSSLLDILAMHYYFTQITFLAS